MKLTLSTVLLIGAGLLIRSMQRIVTADLGFDRDRLAMVRIPTERAGYTPERAAALARTLPERGAHRSRRGHAYRVGPRQPRPVT